MIVDYNGMLASLRAALAQYAVGDDGSGGEEIVAPIEERVQALIESIEATEAHLRGLGFDPASLVGAKGVRASDGLHQRVRLHRLVDVERGQTFHIEARQPHGADDRDAERMLRRLEGSLHIDALAIAAIETLFHKGAMWDDVESPLPEVGDFVLRLTDDDPDDRLIEPVGLGLQVCRLFKQHGARGGAPRGKRNGKYRHGSCTKEMAELRRLINSLSRTER